ncbi:hypothetical protein PQJ75_28770 [Rhodoplanes sp. TEM]|uniref:Uncharacterized protein n=1 Tax=Rhodoplanes tepidamans TaxID=200616 RepID=A0ABT5JJR5_RHOTP|nr:MULTISPECIES: hypothetical protein [Rhodoplanes]MDC7789606.1 hypothetical protein [Rhodoplanes tepidamans]MDC7987747.1 hypothetical protein [Rhodoplanes sp. TEM]MDQ0354022.1 hypothetical protein [Rhodoplanes tepidamans]
MTDTPTPPRSVADARDDLKRDASERDGDAAGSHDRTAAGAGKKPHESAEPGAGAAPRKATDFGPGGFTDERPDPTGDGRRRDADARVLGDLGQARQTD